MLQKHINKLIKSHTGLKQSKETRERRSETHKKIGVGKWNIGRKVSIETRKKQSNSLPKGKNHPNWKGGINSINDTIRKSLHYKLWRESVFKRDNWTCIWCGDNNHKGRNKTIKLNADHIKPFALYPELRFAIDNGRTLCIPCHKKTETFAGRIKNYNKKLL